MVPTTSQSIFSNGISFDSGESTSSSGSGSGSDPGSGGASGSGSGEGGSGSQGGGSSEPQPQTQTVNFTAPAAWTATVAETKADETKAETKAASWLTVEPSSGAAGDVTMTVTAQPNDTYEDRAASVTIKSGSASSSFTVKQAGKPRPVEVTEVKLDKTEQELVEGDTETITATVSPDNASNKTVTWTSSDPAVATVDNGKVTAVKAGEATITAKAGEKTAECKVTVKAKETPTPTPTPDPTPDPGTGTGSGGDAGTGGDIGAGQGGDSGAGTTPQPPANHFTGTKWGYVDGPVTWTFTFTDNEVLFDYLNTASGTPTKEQYKASYTYTQSTVSFTLKVWSGIEFILKGTLTGNSLVFDDSGIQNHDFTMVPYVEVTSITLDQTSIDLKVGESKTLVASVNPNNATNKNVTWSSSDEFVATVDQNGTVTAVKSGSATITAKAGDKTATCTIKVPVQTGGNEGIGYEDL